MKTTLTIILALVASVGMAQKKQDTTFVSPIISDVSTYNNAYVLRADTKLDTVPVIAFCIDTATLETKFRKIYAIYGYSKPWINFNGMLVYQEYLDAEKKPVTQYKVIYAIK